ncbi:hypothetical protein EDD18DRAFT_227800 [Armillaria luteobubalina]|uniref:Uncharacterized protein n=1 Tax=Armillaria luteobubalina TaxID=153913 RepID=A0AA39USX7_9AGAR|nr:hypothetical protein EDD18DRAFT_227800 [Armillaria luteobubalina]
MTSGMATAAVVVVGGAEGRGRGRGGYDDGGRSRDQGWGGRGGGPGGPPRRRFSRSPPPRRKSRTPSSVGSSPRAPRRYRSPPRRRSPSYDNSPPRRQSPLRRRSPSHSISRSRSPAPLGVDLVHPHLHHHHQVAVTKAEQVVVLLLVDAVCLILHLLQVGPVLLREDTDGAAPVGASLLLGGANVVRQGQERLFHPHVIEVPAGSVAKLANLALAQVTACLPGAVQSKWTTTRQN